MGFEELLKIKDMGRSGTAFDRLEELARRSSLSASVFDRLHERSLGALMDKRAYDEVTKTNTLGLLDSATGVNWRQHMAGLTESLSSRVLRDPAIGNPTSSLLAAQSTRERDWACRLSALTTGPSSRSAGLISNDFLSGIKDNVPAKFHSYIENETRAFRHSIGIAAERPSVSAFATLTATVNATSFITAAKLIRGFDEDAAIVKRIFEPSVVYGQFAARTLEQLTNSASESHRAVLAGSLLMAETQAIRTTNLLTPLAEHFGRLIEKEPGPAVICRRQSSIDTECNVKNFSAGEMKSRRTQAMKHSFLWCRRPNCTT